MIVVTFAHRSSSPARMTVFSKGHVGRVIRGDVGTELICSPHHWKRGVPIDVDRIEVANRSLGDLANEGAPDSWGCPSATFGEASQGVFRTGSSRLPRLGGVMDKDLVDQVIDVAQRVVASGAISANGHGNVSLRVPGAEEMYFTAGPSLRNHAPASVVRVGLDGTLLEGDLPPIQGAVVAMHTPMYADHPDVGCVLHTHSPYATAYAVAHRPIGCWVEALAMFGLPTGVPVAGYGPRGSDQAVANIRASITPGVPAVLLANHGVLVFHRTPELAILVGGIVEEAAQAGVNAGSLGGPIEIPEELRAAALQRAMIFESKGTAHG